MKTFRVASDDIVFNRDGRLELIGGNEEIRQSVERICTTNIREWFLDINFGLDYEAIEGKGVTVEDIKLALRRAIFQDERVIEVNFNKVHVYTPARELEVNIDVTIKDGEVIKGIEVII